MHVQYKCTRLPHVTATIDVLTNFGIIAYEFMKEIHQKFLQETSFNDMEEMDCFSDGKKASIWLGTLSIL